MERFTFVLLIFATLSPANCSELEPKMGFNCSAQKTCGGCAAESPKCRWCKADNFSGGERCNDVSFWNESNCRTENIVSPSSEIHHDKNDVPRNAMGNDPPIQLAPQEIRIDLRPNEPFQFQMYFRQAENYPVDIYFIMDVSYTMRSYKKTLADFTDKLVGSIRNITTDFRLGFGSFVDKTVLPFVLTGANNTIIDQCDTSYGCSLPYGFKNQLKLTTNENEFKLKVSQLAISGNLDAPEGGFDAIMQAIVCMEEIGWREKSRKMILFSTDGSFHYAGDGKLGGIVIPNDGHCHLTSEGLYSESTNQDYPSINQLAQKISEKKVNVIFMVPEKQVHLYKRLSEHILGSNVGQLAQDSSNVIDLVKENYDRIRSAVELKEENLGDLKIGYRVKCSSGVQTNPRCEGVGIGEIISFNVTIMADSCPSDRSQWNKTFIINPVGLTESLKVNVRLICECGCELDGVEEKNSARCNLSGTYECGICTCNSGFNGKICNCGTGDEIQNDMACRLTNTSEECQGKGVCECGQCNCGPLNPAQPDRKYSGQYCQCNNYNCEYNLGEICGGPSKGTCNCGTCHCKESYTGTDCGCLKSKAACLTKSGVECNSHGTCECGACTCTDVFKGPTCEDCPTCPGKCEGHRPCVECHFRKENKEKCNNNCTDMQLVTDLNDLSDWRECKFRDDDQCDIRFVYNYKTNEVKVKKDKECVYRASKLVIILSVIGVVIAVGIIALLIWKVVVTFHDKREYQAFVDEQTKCRWDVAQNPIYKDATTNFQNPTYRPTSSMNH